jgi:hypothetical protein
MNSAPPGHAIQALAIEPFPIRVPCSTITRGCVVVALAACGRVGFDAPLPDAPPDAPPDAGAASCVPAPLITTIETADASFASACLHGRWFLQAANGTTVPPAPGRPGNTAGVVPVPITIGSDPLDPSSTFAVHVAGSGQQNVGTTFSFAQLTVSLGSASEARGSIDVTPYTGVQFYAIVNTARSGARLTVGDLYTDPVGGLCTTTPGQPTSCFDHPGAQLTVTTTWTKYQIPFASLTQIGFGNPSPVGPVFPRDAITLLKWDIGIPMTEPTGPWELWVDDLTFY